VVSLAVVLNSHENSPTFKDTLESVRNYWTDRVLIVVDAKGWSQFSEESSLFMLEGFHHGKSSAPYRNMCLGLMKAWETWGATADWYCYMEYDCLVGSSITKCHLEEADRKGVWIVGNDYRTDPRSIPFLDGLEKSRLPLHYLLGCCLFFSRTFMSTLAYSDFFGRFLQFTNFRTDDPCFLGSDGRLERVYDVSEFMYPSLAIKYGGRVAELDCWEGTRWRNGGENYPMRFRPDLLESNYEGSCVMHPLKSFDSPAREHHRHRRGLTRRS